MIHYSQKREYIDALTFLCGGEPLVVVEGIFIACTHAWTRMKVNPGRSTDVNVC
jgi:hypothetical protein